MLGTVDPHRIFDHAVCRAGGFQLCVASVSSTIDRIACLGSPGGRAYARVAIARQFADGRPDHPLATDGHRLLTSHSQWRTSIAAGALAEEGLDYRLMMGVVYSFVAIPFETRLACRAMCRQPAEPVFAPSSGQVVAITADGSTVDRNTLLVEIRDFKKEQLLRKLSLEVVALQATVLRLREQEATDSAIAQTLPAVQAVLDGKQEQLQLARTELERMQIRSSIAGTWCCRIAPANTDHSGPTGESEFSEKARAFNEQLAMGSAVELGQLLGRVHSSAPLIVEAVLPEADLDLLDFSRPVHLRLDYSPAKDLLAEIVEVQPPERKRVDADAKLTDQHTTSDRRGARKAWASSHLIVRMQQLKEPTDILLPVNAGTALMPTRPMSAGQRCWRWIQTTFRLP